MKQEFLTEFVFIKESNNVWATDTKKNSGYSESQKVFKYTCKLQPLQPCRLKHLQALQYSSQILLNITLQQQCTANTLTSSLALCSTDLAQMHFERTRGNKVRMWHKP